MSDAILALPPITADHVDPHALVDPDKYKSVTAEILYAHEERPLLVDHFYWNTIDMWPGLPKLHEFRDGWLRSGGAQEGAWQDRIEGTLIAIKAKVAPLPSVTDIRYSSLLYTIPRDRFILGTLTDKRKLREFNATGKTWTAIGHVFKH